ncbi:hypothetical protein HB775_06390 [Rhizobium leguminosarum bv. trifolii]|nr:hypothetical protein HB775_06390 [Rhizobium leguminosarum bv. trifolii]
MAESEKRDDKFTWTYAIWFLPYLAQYWLWWLAPKWDWWIIGLITLALTVIAVAGSICINLARRRWWRVMSLLITPLPWLVIIYIGAATGITPDSVRFALNKQAYLAEIERTDVTTGEPRLRTFALDSMFKTIISTTLVYDESDEIALPSGEQSAAWQQRTQKLCSEKKECVNLYPGSDWPFSVSKVGEHFFIVYQNFIDAFP